MIFAFLGVLSAIIFVIGDIPYVVDTVTAKTKPHRVTWGIIALLNAIGFANQYASGASNSLWLYGASIAMTAVIFLVSIKNGVGGSTRSDVLCLAIGLLGVVLWVLLKSPVYSILTNLLADVAALIPSYSKARKAPETETKISWLIGTVSCLLAAISVGKLDWQLLLLPGAAVILQGYMVYILYIQAPVKTRKSEGLAH